MVDHIKNRLSLRSVLDELGDTKNLRWVALRSQDRTKKCACDRSPCMRCLSTGFLFVDKLVQVYSYLAVHGRDFRTEIGNVNTDTHVYILKHGSYPKNGDFIAELDLDETTLVPRQPFTIRRLFKVQDSKGYRGEEGKIEYWRLYSEEYNFNRGSDIA